MSFAFAQGQSKLVELVFNRQRGRSAIGGRVEPPSLWPPDSGIQEFSGIVVVAESLVDNQPNLGLVVLDLEVLLAILLYDGQVFPLWVR